MAIRPEILSPENLHRLLYACRVVSLGLSEERFAAVVRLQEKMRQTGFTGLTVAEVALCADLWQRLVVDYTSEKKPGHEYLTESFREETIW